MQVNRLRGVLSVLMVGMLVVGVGSVAGQMHAGVASRTGGNCASAQSL